jgi:hypothetical protein
MQWERVACFKFPRDRRFRRRRWLPSQLNHLAASVQ